MDSSLNGLSPQLRFLAAVGSMGSTDGPPVDTSPGVPGCPRGEAGLVKLGEP